MDGTNIIDVNIANFVTITIMAAAGLTLASVIIKTLKTRRAAAGAE